MDVDGARAMKSAVVLIALAVSGCGSTVEYWGADGGSPNPNPGVWDNATANLAGMSSECGNLTLLSARPDVDMLIAGVAVRGLWSSTDGAASWTQLGQGSGSDIITNRTSAIVYDPAHPGIFYESGIYGTSAVYKTTDSGTTFTRLGNIYHSDGVSIDFTDPLRRTLLAGGHEQGQKVYRSSDGGGTWTEVGAGLPADSGSSSIPLVMDAQTHLMGTYASDGAGVFRTTDRGVTWNQVYGGAVRSHPLVASDGAIYWLLDGSGGVIRTTDDGATWTPAGGAGATYARNGGNILEISRGRLVTLGASSLVMSSDRGATWRTFGATLPFQPNGVAYSSFRKGFYIWHFDCTVSVPADAIMRMDFDDSAP